MGDDTEDHEMNDPRRFSPEKYSPKTEKSEHSEYRENNPKNEKEHIGDHPRSQAEKILEQPILIPRSPAALCVQIVALVFLLDFTSAMIFLLFAFLISGASTGLLAAGALVLFFKSIILIGIIVQSTYKWMCISYYITGRQLVIQDGFVNKDDESYELANIRHINVKQDYMAKKLDYGRIELRLATAGLNEDVTLKDAKNPKHFEKVFRNYLG